MTWVPNDIHRTKDLATTAFIQMGFKPMTAEDLSRDAAAVEGDYVKTTVDTRIVWARSNGVLHIESLNSTDYVQLTIQEV